MRSFELELQFCPFHGTPLQTRETDKIENDTANGPSESRGFQRKHIQIVIIGVLGLVAVLLFARYTQNDGAARLANRSVNLTQPKYEGQTNQIGTQSLASPPPEPSPTVDITKTDSWKSGHKVGLKYGKRYPLGENERNRVNFMAQAAVSDYSPKDPIAFAAGFRIGFWASQSRTQSDQIQKLLKQQINER